MNTDIIAILGVAGTFIVPFIVLLIERRGDDKIYVNITKSRKANIEGKWSGRFIGAPGDKINANETIFEVNLRVGKKRVNGELNIIGEHFKGQNKITVGGGFRNDRFLILNYNSYNLLQFGTIVLELKPTNDKLIGKLVGFGHISETTVSGGVFLEKLKSKIEIDA